MIASFKRRVIDKKTLSDAAQNIELSPKKLRVRFVNTSQRSSSPYLPPYHMGAVSVLKTDIKGDRLPHSIREKRGDLRQAFPYIYKRCKLRSTIGKGRGKQASAGERHSSPTTPPKIKKYKKRPFWGIFH